jgi:hypothetical protein
MDVVQVLRQPANGRDRSVGNILTFGKDEISESWSCRYDTSDCVITNMFASCKIQNAKRIKD